MIKKYYKYEKGQSVIAIPSKLAETLGWNHLCDIEISLEIVKGKKGLFLKKKE